MLNQNLVKQEFDHLLKVHYLNSASKAIPPKSVQEAYHGFMDDYVALYGDKVKERFQSTIDETRQQLAKLINAQPSEIGFVKNTSEGIGIIANGYPFKPGENIILSDQEHCANKNVWIELQNKGFELKLSTRNIEGPLTWNSVATISRNRNEITALGPDNAPIYYNPGYAMQMINTVGSPIYSFFGMVYDGVYMNQAEIDADPASYPGVHPGDGRYKDLNGDEVINAKDRTIIGDYQPDFIWSLSTGTRNHQSSRKRSKYHKSK